MGPPPAAGATEVAAQMVANNLKKLSKGDYSAMRISGKRAEVSSWLYVFEKTCAGVFGGVANRLIRPTRTPGAVTFTQAEWAAMEPWQREYVRLVDGELYTMVLKLIQRDTETGQTLLSNIIENDATIRGGAGLIKFVCYEAAHLSPAECKLIKLQMKQVKMGISDDGEQLRGKASSIRTLYNSMPAKQRGTEDVLREALLSAMPPQCSKQKDDLEATINMRESMGESLPTYEQLTTSIVTAVLTKATAEGSSSLSLIAPSGGKQKYPCKNCGSLKHLSKACDRLCPNAACKLAYCGHLRGACPVGKGKAMPAEIKDHFNKPIPDYL